MYKSRLHLQISSLTSRWPKKGPDVLFIFMNTYCLSMGRKKNEKCDHIKNSLCKENLKVKIQTTSSDTVLISVLHRTKKKKCI